MTWVIDASALVPMFVAEQQSQAVQGFLQAGPDLVAPDTLAGEFANALWKVVRQQRLLPDAARHALTVGLRMIATVSASPPLTPRALDLALARTHPVYDCIYVALAEREGLPLATCDERLATVFSDLVRVRLLGPAPATPAPRRKTRRTR